MCSGSGVAANSPPYTLLVVTISSRARTAVLADRSGHASGDPGCGGNEGRVRKYRDDNILQNPTDRCTDPSMFIFIIARAKTNYRRGDRYN